MWCSEAGRAVLAGALALGLAGCGFEPMYDQGAPAQAMLGRIAVGPVEGAPAFEMRERLTERLGAGEGADLILDVDLDLRREGVALTQQNVTTRFNIIGTADFALRPAAGGPAVVTGQVRNITGYSAPDSATASAFASLSAERDAESRVARTLADQIVLRLALQAEEFVP
jgi:LPS-assembly lipoprotein